MTRRIDLKRIHTAHFGTMRAINRQIVLNYVRDHGPISRAEIARRTALQRSTISEIVDSLLGEGLVEEIGSGRSTGGRCPTLLGLRASGAAAVGIDIGPARTTVAACDLAGCVLEREEFETDHDFDRTLRRAAAAAGRLLAHSPGNIGGIGVSLPGLVDPSTSRVSSARRRGSRWRWTTTPTPPRSPSFGSGARRSARRATSSWSSSPR